MWNIFHHIVASCKYIIQNELKDFFFCFVWWALLKFQYHTMKLYVICHWENVCINSIIKPNCSNFRYLFQSGVKIKGLDKMKPLSCSYLAYLEVWLPIDNTLLALGNGVGMVCNRCSNSSAGKHLTHITYIWYGLHMASRPTIYTPPPTPMK